MTLPAIEDTYPLSPIQEGMLFDHLYSRRMGLNVTHATLELEEELEVETFRRAWQAAFDACPVLRTGFRWSGGGADDGAELDEPVQDVHAGLELPMHFEDWSELSAAEQEPRWEALRNADLEREFDLSAPPLTRVVCVRLGPAHWRVLWSHHHILLDGPGILGFMQEALGAYDAARRGAPFSFAERPSFAEFVAWQRAVDTRSEAEFWRARLAGIEQPNRPAFDRGAPREPATGLVHVQLGRDSVGRLGERVRHWVKEHGTTPNTLWQAAWGYLMSCYSEEQRVVFGAIRSCRYSSPERFEGLLGLALNTLPMPVDCDPALSIEDWLASVRSTWNDLRVSEREQASLVFVKEQSEYAARSPLFESMFCYDATSFDGSLERIGAHWPGRSANALGQSNIPLQFNVYDGDEVDLRLRYDSRRFERAQVERMFDHVTAVVESLLAGARTVGELSMLSPAERVLLVRDWNATAREYPRDRCLHELVEAQAARTPDAVAVGGVPSGEGSRTESLTYAELEREAGVLAGKLAELGVGRGQLVGLCVERTPRMVAALLGILKSGAGYVPLDPDFPADRLRFVLEDAGVAALVADAGTRERNPLVGEFAAGKLAGCADAPLLVLGEIDAKGSDGGATRSPVRPDPDDVAYAIYTSGSTGRPKGVRVTHRNVVNFLASMQREPGLAADDVLLAVTTLSFDIAGLELYLPLTVGARVVVAPRDVATDGFALLQALETTGATVVQATPATWQMLLHAGWEGDRHLKVLCGGEALPPSLAAELVARAGEVWNLYGPTETTIWSSVARIEADEPVTLGRPIANTQLYVLDADLEPVSVGVTGELYIGGDGVALDYLGRPELTAERFVASPFQASSQRAGQGSGEEQGARLYRTGDRVRHDGEGRLVYAGRADFQVKVRGYRIELGEIEVALAAEPGVREAVVVVREDPAGQPGLVAYVVQEAGASSDTGELTRALRTTLPEYMVPPVIVALDELPRTPNGKLDRKALPEPTPRQSSEQFQAPEGELQQAVAELWTELLGVERVGAQSDFFLLGGHSLLVTRMLSRLRKRFDVELTGAQVFSSPTVAGVAEAIESARSDVGRVAGGAAAMIPVAARGGRVPLSFPQRRLWLLHQMGAADAYNMQLSLRMRGELDRGALDRALRAVALRHEVLRTRFESEDGVPVAVVEPAPSLVLTELERTGSEWAGEAEREHFVRELTIAGLEQPFDLASGPALRGSLVRFAADDHALVLVLHHIIGDIGSLGVLTREIGEHYRAFAEGVEPNVPELPVQYADFAVWQLGRLSGETLERQVEHWRKRLEDAPLALELPTDHQRPATQTFRGSSHLFRFGPELTAALRACAGAHHVTPAMFCLATFQLLLARHSRQEDVVVGMAVANRVRTEVEGLVGMFVNTLAMRTDLSDDPTFAELLARVQAVGVDAYDHQEVPFEKLVEVLAPEREMSRTPVVQVVFSMNENLPLELETGALDVQVLPFEATRTRFDLELHLFDRPDDVEAIFIYSTDLFDPATIARYAERFETLLAGAARQPALHLSELPFLPAAERALVLGEWSRSVSDYPRDASVHELFAEQAHRAPDAIALEFGAERVSYGELERGSNRLARYLIGLGVGPGVHVGLALERSVEVVVAMLAVLKTGAAYVPLDPGYPRVRLAYMLEDTGAPVVVTLARYEALLPETEARRVRLDSDAAEIAACSDADTSELVTASAGSPAEALAYVIYTSGSTGRPKGVRVPHRGIVRLVCGADYVQLEATDRVAQAANVSFDATTWEVWGPLLNGGTVVALGKDVTLEPETFARALREREITALFVTTALFNQLAATVPDIFGSLRCLLFGGEAVDPVRVRGVLADGAPGRLLHVYGPTENTTFSTWFEVTEVPRDARTVPIGGPIANTTQYVVDPTDRPVPIGVPGELLLGGDGLAHGYLGDPELTAKRFVPMPFSDAGADADDRLYRTGDLVKWRDDGALEFCGRVDHQVKLRGFRIELGEIEAALRAHPNVEDAVVCLLGDVGEVKRLAAFVVPNEAAAREEDAGEFREIEEEHIAEWHSLYDLTYEEPEDLEDEAFNLAGWNSSYTGQAIAPEEMAEWVEATVARIRSCAPRRVLEIGVGSGLLMHRIAPDCEKYVGTDFSEKVLEQLGRSVAARGLDQVELLPRLATNFDGIEPRSFDTVLINSVVQYFPSIEYLVEVLEGAVEAVRDGGHLFLGDLRNLPLLPAFHADVELFRANPELTVAALAQAVQTDGELEGELVLDPAFFHALCAAVPRLCHAQVLLKHGWAHNELTGYRFDVVLHVGASADSTRGASHDASPWAPEVEHWRDWTREGLSLDTLGDVLAASVPAGASIGLCDIPNARVTHASVLLARLRSEEPPESLEVLRAEVEAEPDGVELEALRAVAAEHGFTAECSYAASGDPARMDAVLWRCTEESTTATGAPVSRAAGAPRFPGPPAPLEPRWRKYANDPVRGGFTRLLVPKLRELLQADLPDYMVPGSFQLLDALPTTPNGKVDRRALASERYAPTAQSDSYVAPRNTTETKLAEIWSGLLRVEPVGVHDDFFELGGHSLLGMQLVSRLKQDFEVDLPLQRVFETPTVAGLSEHLDTLVWASGRGTTLAAGGAAGDGSDGAAQEEDVEEFEL